MKWGTYTTIGADNIKIQGSLDLIVLGKKNVTRYM